MGPQSSSGQSSRKVLNRGMTPTSLGFAGTEALGAAGFRQWRERSQVIRLEATRGQWQEVAGTWSRWPAASVRCALTVKFGAA